MSDMSGLIHFIRPSETKRRVRRKGQVRPETDGKAKEALRLRRTFQLTYKQIGERLGMTGPRAYQLIKRAREMEKRSNDNRHAGKATTATS